MRTAAQPHSVVRYPFSAIFGTEAAVRVLRELSLGGHERAPAFLAERTRVTIQTVRRTLERLVALGVVDLVGQGRYPSYRLSPRHPLRKSIDALFRAEAARVERIFDGIRHAANELPVQPEAVWIYGSVARGEDASGSDLDMAVVYPEEAVERTTAKLREALEPLEEQQAVSISVVGLSPADVKRLAAGDLWWRSVEADGFPLLGLDPRNYALTVRRRTAKVAERSG